MELTRRGFLKGILLAGVAPAIVRADSLMRIIPRDISLLPIPPIIPLGSPGSGWLWPGVNKIWEMHYKEGLEHNLYLYSEDFKIALPSDWSH